MRNTEADYSLFLNHARRCLDKINFSYVNGSGSYTSKTLKTPSKITVTSSKDQENIELERIKN